MFVCFFSKIILFQQYYQDPSQGYYFQVSYPFVLCHKIAGIFPVPPWLCLCFVVVAILFVFEQESFLFLVFDTTGNYYGRFVSLLALKCHDPLKQMLLTQSQSAALR